MGTQKRINIVPEGMEQSRFDRRVAFFYTTNIAKARGAFLRRQIFMITKAVLFLKEAKVELQKVTWLTRKQVVHYSFLVIAISIIVAAFLGSLDLIFSGIMEK